MTNNAEHYFSPDYATARRRFCEAGSNAGARLFSLDIGVKAPDQSPLTIDIAWLGSDSPSEVLLHSSGLHGVEGFAGSAIQLKFLDALPRINKNQSIVLVHILNPYGMAWLRRMNKSNVDLNRNFLEASAAWAGVSDAYRNLNPFLNPSSAVSSPEGDTSPEGDSKHRFFLHLFLSFLKYGYGGIRQAIAEGQYEYPQGLFFGGKELQTELRLYSDWLKKYLIPCPLKNVFAIDVHTGLGPWQRESIFIGPKQAQNEPYYKKVLPRRSVRVAASGPGMPYTTYGALCFMLPDFIGKEKSHSIAQELGTYSPLSILYALREENWLYHHGNPSELSHPAKAKLKKIFCPVEPGWRDFAVGNGVSLLQVAASATFG